MHAPPSLPIMKIMTSMLLVCTVAHKRRLASVHKLILIMVCKLSESLVMGCSFSVSHLTCPTETCLNLNVFNRQMLRAFKKHCSVWLV